jgi:hypothetical protein
MEELRALAKQVEVPAPPPAAKNAPPIGVRRIAPVQDGQRAAQVRPEGDREAVTGLVKRPRPLGLSREPWIAFGAVHDGTKRAQAGRLEVHEVQSVEPVESNVGQQKVEGPEAYPGARRLEPAVTFYVCVRRRRRVQNIPRRVVRLDEEDMRARAGLGIH